MDKTFMRFDVRREKSKKRVEREREREREREERVNLILN